jgi:hypothetical protein
MVRLILFSHHKPDRAPLFLCLEAENVIKKKGVWYHVDCRAAKAVFLVSVIHINPDMRVKIPSAMMAKRVLQQGVKEQDAEDAGLPGGGKNQGIGSPPLTRPHDFAEKGV